MSKSKPVLRVFLCHAHQDKEIVQTLYTRILEAGIHAWLDSEELRPGQDWQYAIRRELLKSDLVIVCLSNNFNKQTGFRHEELKMALKKAQLLDQEDIFIIPVRLESCDMPESLKHLQRVDLFEAGGYKKLIQALREHARER
jgi:hypothetical protein